MKRFLILSIMIPLLSSSPTFGQWYDWIQTESDWEYLYRDGYFDYNTYQIYREIVESEIIADTSEYLISSMGTSPVEIANSDSYSENRTFSTWKRLPMTRPDYIKIGRKIKSDDNGGYVTIGKNWNGSSTRMRFDDDDGEWRAAYRQIDYESGDLNVTIGNYSVSAGCGAGIGRFDYRPLSFEPEFRPGEDLLFPDNSFYNGMKIEIGSLAVLYSSKKYDEVRKNLFGGYWIVGSEQAKAGVTAAAAILSSSGERRNLGSGSLFGEFYNGRLSAEIAYGESGPGYCLRVVDGSLTLKAWHYDDSYINLQSSGFAHPDYESFSDDRFEISFRQPQRGETGLFTGYRAGVGGVGVTGSAEIWKKSVSSEMAMFSSLYFGIDLTRDLLLNAGIMYKDSYISRRSTLDFKATFTRRIEIETRSYMRFSDNDIDRRYSRYHILASFPAGRDIVLRGRFRWNYAGEFDYFMEQKTALGEGLFLTATYRWNGDDDVDLGPFFLILDKRW